MRTLEKLLHNQGEASFNIHVSSNACDARQWAEARERKKFQNRKLKKEMAATPFGETAITFLSASGDQNSAGR
jgi:hypothetical protein